LREDAKYVIVIEEQIKSPPT